jgi:hypothetical protein
MHHQTHLPLHPTAGAVHGLICYEISHFPPPLRDGNNGLYDGMNLELRAIWKGMAGFVPP